MYGAVTNRSAPLVTHLFISSHPFSIIKYLLSSAPSVLSISYRMYHHHYPPPTIGPCRTCTCTSTQRLAIPSDFALLSDFILHSASSPYSKRISLRRHLKVFFFSFLSRSLQLDSGLGRYHHRLSDFTVILGLAFSI